MKHLIHRTLRTKRVGIHQTDLRQCLTAFDLTLLGVGAIIGTGIFVLTGHAAAHQAGPAVMLSFVFAGLACAFAALCYAELASTVGGCGSAYGYSYAAFGEIIAWVMGWDLILEYGMSVAAVANGWSGYFSNGLSALDYPLPDLLTHAPAKGGLINLPAALIILALMLMLIVGVKASARLNAGMVLIKVLTISVFIAVASGHVDPSNWHPFMPYGWFDTLADGKTVGVLAGASVVFFAYIGFDAVSTAVEEARDPQRDVPKGIIHSLIFCTVIYIVVAGLLTSLLPYDQLGVDSPVAYAMQKIGINWAAALISTGVIAGLTTVMLVLYYGLTRIIFAMSRDGLLPASLNHLQRNTHSPVRVILLTGIMIALMAGFIPLDELAELVNIGTLAAFVLVCGGVMLLRRRAPELKRPFKVPYGDIIPALGLLSCAALMMFLPALAWLRFGIWLVIGLLVYFMYSIRHSKLND
jgi:APA family basic amino acid/polyamine antiporter